jgi:hypothetical protein
MKTTTTPTHIRGVWSLEHCILTITCTLADLAGEKLVWPDFDSSRNDQVHLEATL